VKLFEFEAKDILRKHGLSIPKGRVVSYPSEAEAIAKEIGKPVALKSQVLVSGRGKAGGIAFAGNATDAGKVASDLLDKFIKGSLVYSLLVEEKLDIAVQFYVSISIDRQARRYIVLFSTSGGVDIEEVALASPHKILRYWVDPDAGFAKSTAEAMVAQSPEVGRQDMSRLASILATLYEVAMECDAELVEINPLVKTSSGEFVAADARMIIDDNALFRHPEFETRSFQRVEDTPREAEARRQGLAYVDLVGDIGIVGNGAGLVMATMDVVGYFGGRAANFLDIGGGAQTEVVKKGLMLVMSKPEVKAVLVNILGGITRCDVVAEGIVKGISESSFKKPIVVRLIGTNDKEGREILHQAGINVYSDMETAAREVVKV